MLKKINHPVSITRAFH